MYSHHIKQNNPTNQKNFLSQNRINLMLEREPRKRAMQFDILDSTKASTHDRSEKKLGQLSQVMLE